ncbi:unnamed protein product [Periconia digitata]|uniref:Secreted protein n=1 Tax=Periconia digitata TaxID=1303443 RepID=A0A9W4UB31_9PLEO|nr:unnamed protein product [Periconia digitata]
MRLPGFITTLMIGLLIYLATAMLLGADSAVVPTLTGRSTSDCSPRTSQHEGGICGCEEKNWGGYCAHWTPPDRECVSFFSAKGGNSFSTPGTPTITQCARCSWTSFARESIRSMPPMGTGFGGTTKIHKLWHILQV